MEVYVGCLGSLLGKVLERVTGVVFVFILFFFSCCGFLEFVYVWFGVLVGFSDFLDIFR